MKNFIVALYNGNNIISLLGQFRTSWDAKCFIEDNYIEFHKDICQYSKYQSPLFIRIERP